MQSQSTLARALAAGGLLMASLSAHALDQWASKIVDYSSQYASQPYGSWSAERILGAPDVTTYGDNVNAWTTATADAGTEFIQVGFENPVYSEGVWIYESFGSGFVTQVDVIGTDNVVRRKWRGTDPSLPDRMNILKLRWSRTPYLVKGVRITIDTSKASGYEEIDAVKLRGTPSLSGALAPRLEHTAQLVCQNLTTKQKITRTISGSGSSGPVTKWDCDRYGFDYSPGDKVSIRITGVVND